MNGPSSLTIGRASPPMLPAVLDPGDPVSQIGREPCWGRCDGRPRLVRERLYDAACLISTVRGEGIYAEPLLEVSTVNLTAAIAGRIAYIQGIM